MMTVEVRHIEATRKVKDLLRLGVNACNRAARRAGDNGELWLEVSADPDFPAWPVLGKNFDVWVYEDRDVECAYAVSEMIDEDGTPIGGDVLLALLYEYAPAVAKKLFINPDTLEIRLRKSVPLYTD